MSRRNLTELREQADAIDRENGELQAEIQKLEQQLELTRASLGVYQRKKQEDSILTGFPMALLMIVLSIWLIFK